MSLYYDGNLEMDLQEIRSDEKVRPYLCVLETAGHEIGYGRMQQILQVLWAQSLKEQGYPTNGALFR